MEQKKLEWKDWMKEQHDRNVKGIEIPMDLELIRDYIVEFGFVIMIDGEKRENVNLEQFQKWLAKQDEDDETIHPPRRCQDNSKPEYRRKGKGASIGEYYAKRSRAKKRST